jgi:protein SCO1
VKTYDIINSDLQFSPKDFDSSTPEDLIAKYIDHLKKNSLTDPRVVELLPQENLIYTGRGTNQINRIRGYIFALFEHIGLPENAFIYVCEELENSRDPYVVAGASMAVRGLFPPGAYAATYLCKALTNIGVKDNAVNFETYKPQWDSGRYTTATKEILLTLKWLGKAAENALEFLERYAKQQIVPVSNENRRLALEAINAINNDKRAIQYSCCSFPKINDCFKFKKKNHNDIRLLKLENQDGNTLTFSDFFCNIPAVVSFFYTRCDNPNKCSLTISKLSQLQLLLEEAGLRQSIKIAAITYDPGYDGPERIKSYLENRQFRIDNNNNGFRVINGGENIVRNYFSLGVNFIGSIVNHHRIELFVLNEKGKIIKEFSKLQWDPSSVADFCKNYLQPNSNTNFATKLKKYAFIIYNSLIPILLAFFPKCPLCWAAYLSAFGISGVSWLKYNPKYLPVLIVAMLLNVFIIYRQYRLNNYYPLILSLSGSSLLVVATVFDFSMILKICGMALVITSSLVNTFSISHFRNITRI